MSIQRPIRLTLAGAMALALCGTASLAAAQQATPATTQATTQSAPATGTFYQGTETTATYPLPNSNGGTLTVHAGMPADMQTYGPPPSFTALDANHDGHISEAEASAYPPLDSDFLDASRGGTSISRTQYEAWVKSID